MNIFSFFFYLYFSNKKKGIVKKREKKKNRNEKKIAQAFNFTLSCTEIGNEKHGNKNLKKRYETKHGETA